MLKVKTSIDPYVKLAKNRHSNIHSSQTTLASIMRLKTQAGQIFRLVLRIGQMLPPVVWVLGKWWHIVCVSHKLYSTRRPRSREGHPVSVDLQQIWLSPPLLGRPPQVSENVKKCKSCKRYHLPSSGDLHRREVLTGTEDVSKNVQIFKAMEKGTLVPDVSNIISWCEGKGKESLAS